MFSLMCGACGDEALLKQIYDFSLIRDMATTTMVVEQIYGQHKASNFTLVSQNNKFSEMQQKIQTNKIGKVFHKMRQTHF